MKWLLTICLCCLALPALAPIQYTIGTTGRTHSSYDSMESYPDGVVVNNLAGYTTATLGATWINSYVDRANAFGLQVYDTMESYSDATPANGLLAVTWANPFVDRQNTFPMFTEDTIESYGDAANVNGLNGGTDNGTSVVWNGAYVVH